MSLPSLTRGRACLALPAAALLAFASSCVVSPPDAATDRPRSIETARWIDLTHAYDAETVFWPTGKPFEHLETAWGVTGQGYFYSSFDLYTSEHAGTHIDAPIHFSAGKRTVDEIPLDELAGPAAVVDVSVQVAANPDYLVSPEDLARHEQQYGPIEAGAIVLIRSGWSERWPDAKAYLGDDTPGRADNLHFPGIGPAAARALVERRVKAVGIDTASIDHGPSRDFQTHQILLGAQIPGLENLTGLVSLPARGAWVIAMPMKIGRGSGGPCRVAALIWPEFFTLGAVGTGSIDGVIGD